MDVGPAFEGELLVPQVDRLKDAGCDLGAVVVHAAEDDIVAVLAALGLQFCREQHGGALFVTCKVDAI